MLTNEQIAYLQAILKDWQEELTYRLEQNEHFGLELSMAKDAVGELSNYDNHPADQGTEVFERSKDLALNEHAEKELADVEAALEAIEQGTYGICQVCREAISYERLKAVPTATRCINHANE